MRFTLFAALLAASATTAPAQFRRNCVTCSPPAAATKVQIVQQSPPAIYIINQVPGVPQGSTTYTASSYPEIPLVDVNRLAQQTLALLSAAQESHERHSSQSLATIAAMVESNRTTAETVARGAAAAEALRATAGRSTHSGSAAADPLLTEQPGRLIDTACGKCHTVDAAAGAKLTDAQGAFRLDADFDAAAAINQVLSGKMPPEKPLSQADQLIVIGQLLGNVQQ